MSEFILPKAPNYEGALLLAKDVTMRFGGVTAVSDLSIALPKGAIAGIIGPNGAGKTTAFNVLMFVVAGGLGSLSGSLLGATVITILLEWLRAIEEPMDLGFVEIPGIPGMRMVVFSLVLLAIILYRREGIMGTREITWKTIGAFLRRSKA